MSGSGGGTDVVKYTVRSGMEIPDELSKVISETEIKALAKSPPPYPIIKAKSDTVTFPRLTKKSIEVKSDAVKILGEYNERNKHKMNPIPTFKL